MKSLGLFLLTSLISMSTFATTQFSCKSKNYEVFQKEIDGVLVLTIKKNGNYDYVVPVIEKSYYSDRVIAVSMSYDDVPSAIEVVGFKTIKNSDKYFGSITFKEKTESSTCIRLN